MEKELIVIKKEPVYLEDFLNLDQCPNPSSGMSEPAEMKCHEVEVVSKVVSGGAAVQSGGVSIGLDSYVEYLVQKEVNKLKLNQLVSTGVQTDPQQPSCTCTCSCSDKDPNNKATTQDENSFLVSRAPAPSSNGEGSSQGLESVTGPGPEAMAEQLSSSSRESEQDPDVPPPRKKTRHTGQLGRPIGSKTKLKACLPDWARDLLYHREPGAKVPPAPGEKRKRGRPQGSHCSLKLRDPHEIKSLLLAWASTSGPVRPVPVSSNGGSTSSSESGCIEIQEQGQSPVQAANPFGDLFKQQMELSHFWRNIQID